MHKRTFDREFKLQITRQLVTGHKRLSQLCREHNLGASLVRNWKQQYESQGENAWLDQEPHVNQDKDARIAALEAALGRAHLENEFLRDAFSKISKKHLAPR